MVKDGPEARISEEALDVNRGCQKLTVVDLLVIVVVHLIYHLANLRITYVQSFGDQDVVQLLSPDHSRSIRVDGLKLSTEVFHLILSRCLHEQIHSCFLERRNTFEAAQSGDDIIADLLFTALMHGHSQLGAVAPFLEPRMIQRLLSTNSLLLVQDEQLPDQILAFVGDLIKLAVSEVVVSLLDLAEDLCSILALEG